MGVEEGERDGTWVGMQNEKYFFNIKKILMCHVM